MLSNGYILILIWVGVIAALAVMATEWVYRTELVNGEKVRRVTPLFAVVAVLGWIPGTYRRYGRLYAEFWRDAVCLFRYRELFS